MGRKHPGSVTSGIKPWNAAGGIEEKLTKKHRKTTPGEMTYLWLDGVRSKASHYVVGSVRHRGSYESWANFMLEGLRNAEFQSEVQSQTDAWSKARTFGQRIKVLAASYRELPEETKAQLALDTEVELKAGMKLVNDDKKAVLELVATAADP